METKKSQTQRVQRFLAEAELKTPIDVETIQTILQKHPNYDSKLENFNYWFVDYSPFKQRSLFIRKKCGEIVAFSFLCCITPNTQKSKFIRALREEIHYQVLAVKSRVGKTFICPICLQLTQKVNCHIDHDINSFKTISEDWCLSKSITLQVGLAITYNGNELPILQDKEMAADWRNFHKAAAVLVPTCCTCNMSKGCGQKLITGPKVSRCLIE
jgi:hypothetical protein